MVNQEPTLQRLILDVFEEQEDSFYFPLRTQKDARAFVKAIHIKGASYELIYQSIGEFEHNFSCWRNGLGRPGIGNRIMELINQPLVDLLEEEDIFPMNGSNGHQREQRSWEDNNRVPPTPHSNTQKQPAVTNQPVKKVDKTDSGPKTTKTTTNATNNSNNRTNSAQSKPVKAQSIPEPVKAQSKPEPVKAQSKPEPVKAQSKPEPVKAQSKPEPMKAQEPAKQSSPLPARSELRKVEKDEKPAQKEQKEEAPKRMVELRRTPPRQENKERPVSEIEKMKQQILKNKEAEGQTLERRRSSSGSSSSGSESGSSSSSISSSSDSETKVEAVLGKFDAIKITDSPVEETPPPKKPERTFLDGQKKEEKVEVKKEEVTKKEEIARTTAAQYEEKREERRKEDQRLEEQKREERQERLKKLKEKYQQAPSGGEGLALDEVDENYNSDLDPENTNQSPVMATLVKKISAMRAAGKNSAGFVFVFTDSPKSTAGKVRVKVGSSRCPNKRLAQAKHFNPDMRLVATYPVSERVSALNDIRTALSALNLDGSPDWFTGALDNIVKLVQDNAEKYPSKTLDDATTGQSES